MIADQTCVACPRVAFGFEGITKTVAGGIAVAAVDGDYAAAAAATGTTATVAASTVVAAGTATGAPTAVVVAGNVAAALAWRLAGNALTSLHFVGQHASIALPIVAGRLKVISPSRNSCWLCIVATVLYTVAAGLRLRAGLG